MRILLKTFDFKLSTSTSTSRIFIETMVYMLDVQSLVKYLLEGLAVAAAAYYIPQKSADLREIGMIALTAAAVFAILDQYAPAVSVGARQGAGFGIGYNITSGLEGYADEEESQSEGEGEEVSEDTSDEETSDEEESEAPEGTDSGEAFSHVL